MLRLLRPRKRFEKPSLQVLDGLSCGQAGFGGTWQQKPPLSSGRQVSVISDPNGTRQRFSDPAEYRLLMTAMADQIRYDLLTQQALRGVVRSVLAEPPRRGLPGEHHFFIAFDTTAEGVRLSERLRAQYPEEMTIVLQHQFWDLKVTDDGLRGRPVVRRRAEQLRCRSRRSSSSIRPCSSACNSRRSAKSRGSGAAPTTPRQLKDEAPAGRPAERTAEPEERAPRQRRWRPSPPPRPSPHNPKAAPKSSGSTASARNSAPPARGHAMAKPRKPKTRTETDSLRADRSPGRPNTGARRPSARCRISASARSACRCRSIRALGLVKRAAAEVNRRLGLLDARRAGAIVAAAEEVDRRQARRSFPTGGLADRLRHADQHERQRGDRQLAPTKCSAASSARSRRCIRTTTST